MAFACEFLLPEEEKLTPLLEEFEGVLQTSAVYAEKPVRLKALTR
jgi:hypothetical protein